MDKILVIDDDESIRNSLSKFLQRLNYQVASAANGETGLEIIYKTLPDLVITDIRMPGITGFDLLQKAKSFDPQIHVIMITAHDDMGTTVQAMQQGAYDYIEKPIDTGRLKATITRALENKKLSEKVDTIISGNIDEYKLGNIIGKSIVMKDVYKIIGHVSNSRVTALISGESGTGKELVAKSIHYSGLTKDQPFIAVNCTAITESLLESELFGHEKGAFTGSVKEKKGKFELAGEGTIFLDEISEMTPNLQVKLLRVLQEKEFERVGGETTILMKARIIAATNKNLAELIKEGKFREDLFFRLNVVNIILPPLRQRKEDIPLLVNYFLTKINHELHKNVVKISEDVMKMLMEYDWKGNVRELENTLLQAVVLSSGDMLVKENILISNIQSANDLLPVGVSLAELEKRYIKQTLDSTNWNKTKTAEILKISAPTLYSKIDFYKLTEE
jgi:DNA-binding NtrC family response regulator